MRRTFRGRIVSGRGLGAAAMADPKMAEAVRRIAGFDLVTRTLNVRLRRRFRGRLNQYIRWEDFGRPVPDPMVPGRLDLCMTEVLIAGRCRGFVAQGDEPDYARNSSRSSARFTSRGP